MHLCSGRAFGLPSVPRQTMPSMFQILTWNDEAQSVPHPQIKNQSSPQGVVQNKQNDHKNLDKQQIKEKIVDNISQVKSQVDSCCKNKRAITTTKHYEIYQYDKAKLKRAQSQSDIAEPKVVVSSSQVIRSKPKLDPTNEEDLKEIKERQKRIKSFEYVTRDLPNSAFRTYYGKPAFEAYGRGNSNPKHLSHNVMPHKGQNHPQIAQSYFAALLKGKRSSTQTVHIPRKPFEDKPRVQQQKHEQVIHLPMQKPDLINHVRFTAGDSRKKDTTIPSSKITPLKQKTAKKQARKQKKKKSSSKKNQLQSNDGLKYLNTRQNLLDLIEKKKINSSKLAYKVTECYPFELENPSKLKQSRTQWQGKKPAGKKSAICDKVSQLLRTAQEST